MPPKEGPAPTVPVPHLPEGPQACPAVGGIPSPPAAAAAYFSCLPETSSHDTSGTPSKQAPWQRTFADWEPSGDPQTDLCQEFRHGGWHVDRTRVYHALHAVGKGDGRLKRFCLCGTGARVLRHKDAPDRVRKVCTKCHDRFCVPCARDRSARLRGKLLPAIGRRRVRMITLTLRAGPDDSLAACVARLKDSFRQLRRLRLWQESVDGEAHFVEVTRGAAHDHWHAHYHVLAVGRYIEQGWLSQAWRVITGDSPIVHVTLAKSLRGVAHYVGKYASKAFDQTTLKSPDHLQEAILALASVRLWDSTGDLRKAMREAEPEEEVVWSDWEEVGSLPDVYRRAWGGDVDAQRIIVLLGVRDPVSGVPPPWLSAEDST